MKRLALTVMPLAVFGLLLGSPAVAGDKAASASNQAKATTESSMRNAWPAENLSGKISAVEPGHRLVVTDADGVPFSMVITAKTRIKAGGQNITFGDLAQYQNKDVSIRFVPERRGDVAESIHIGG